MYTFKFPSLCSFIELNRIFYFELLFYKISTLGFISLNLFLCFLKYSTSLCSISSWKYGSFIYSFLIFIIFFLELLYCPKSSILNQSAGIDNFIFIICFFDVHHFSIFRMNIWFCLLQYSSLCYWLLFLPFFPFTNFPIFLIWILVHKL